MARPLLPLGGKVFVPIRATVSGGKPWDRHRLQPLGHAVAPVDWKDRPPKLRTVAPSRGALPLDARDAVQSALTRLLKGKAVWKRTEGPGLAREMTAMIRRNVCHARSSARHRDDAPRDGLEDAPDSDAPCLFP